MGGGNKVFPYLNLNNNIVTCDDGYKILTYLPGENVEIVGNKKYFSSIIVNGEEQIKSSSDSGSLTIPSLENSKVKVRFKEEISSLSSCFTGCTSLIAIPSNLFADCPNVTDFNFCFSRCSLTIIPEKLFAGCPNVTSFYNCFDNCLDLISIPKNLFTNNTKVTSFGSCFNACYDLEVMPIDSDGTPIYNRSGSGKEGYSIVTKFSSCFYSCKKLLEKYPDIPEDWR